MADEPYRAFNFTLLIEGVESGQFVECAGLGMAGSALGLIAGAGLAAAALHWMAGDLGGGYFPGVTPSLQWTPGALVVFFGLGTVAALVDVQRGAAGQHLPLPLALVGHPRSLLLRRLDG